MNIKDKFDLKGKVAIVTGASKGIGKAIALAFGQSGAKIVVSSRKQGTIDLVVQEFKEQGIESIAIAAHMGKAEDIENLIAQACSQYGRIDILVNNAAANPVFGPVENTDDMAFDKIIEVNVKGPFRLSKAVYPEFKKVGGGSIINISSIGGVSPEPNLGIYSVSKASLISLTQVFAKEWGKDNIRCNVICPGLIKTKFSQALWNNEKILDSMLKELPLGRIGTVEDMAGLALFLAADASLYCTGGVYMADGGHTI